MRLPLLDAWRNPDTDVRVAVDSWWAEVPIAEQYVMRAKSPRLLWNYLQRVGPVAVWRKVRSRLAEDRRNDKVAGVGIGRVLEAPAESGMRTGDRVVFFAPNHSTAWPHICLDRRLAYPADATQGTVGPASARETLSSLGAYIGWSPHSGVALDEVSIRPALSRLATDVRVKTGRPTTPASASASEVVCERLEQGVPTDGRRSAVLFGLGNYAKTQIVPHARRHLRLAAVHEIDPDQIAGAARLGAVLDTSPLPRPGERYDAWFIAGFHHTHAALAVRALADGAYAVVEKPLATTRDQFAGVQRALTGAGARRLFTCFHKRYSRMHEWALADLGVAPGDPVDMHCIVYEIPLPALHWYNWPNSGSRLISNGCHWLDYFLFVNDFVPVVDLFARPLRGNDVVVSVRLVNGAQLVLSLTDRGSDRLGVRDVIDLRARRVTVRLVDGTHYEAENGAQVLRHRRVNPMTAYRRMYQSISRRIAAGDEGDSLESLRSTTLMLDLEDELRAANAHMSQRQPIVTSSAGNA